MVGLSANEVKSEKNTNQQKIKEVIKKEDSKEKGENQEITRVRNWSDREDEEDGIVKIEKEDVGVGEKNGPYTEKKNNGIYNKKSMKKQFFRLILVT